MDFKDIKHEDACELRDNYGRLRCRMTQCMARDILPLEHVEHFSANDVHQLIRMLYKKDKEVERLRSTLMEIATKYNIPVDDIDEL